MNLPVETQSPIPGISLRDYFAGQIIAAIYTAKRKDMNYQELAELAYHQADHMMRARRPL